MSIDQVHVSWSENPASTLTILCHGGEGDPTPTLMWRKNGTHDWTKRPFEWNRPSPGAGVIHGITLRDLEPDTEWEYLTEPAPTGWREPARVRTAPRSPDAGFICAFFGDTGLIGRPDGLTTGTERVYQYLGADRPLFLLGAGDYAYANKDGRFEIADAIDEWFRQAEPVISRAPFLPQYGNHEILLEETFEDWGPRFEVPPGHREGRCYTFRVGAVRFISFFAPGSVPEDEDLDWLERSLQDARNEDAPWLVVYHHDSIYGHGRSHPTDLNVRHMLAPLYEKYAVDLVLNAHDQNYERTYPLREIPHNPTITNSDTARYAKGDGVIFAKVSPAGKKSEIGHRFSRFLTKQHHYVACRNDSDHHYALLHCDGPNTLRLEVFAIPDGRGERRVFESFTILS